MLYVITKEQYETTAGLYNPANWGFPEWALLVYLGIHCLCAIGLHNEPKTGKWNAPWLIFSAIIWLVILYYGGFFA